MAFSSAPSAAVGWITLEAKDGTTNTTREEPALQHLEWLILAENRITDVGMRALAEVVGSGAIPSCTSIVLEGNPGSAGQVMDALACRAGGREVFAG